MVPGRSSPRLAADDRRKRFAARQSHWFQVENDKLAEHWATREDLVAMLQLGVVQPPGRPPS